MYVFKFSTTSNNNTGGARTSEVVETHPLLKVESRMNSTGLRKYIQLFQFHGSVHHVSVNENTNLMQQS